MSLVKWNERSRPFLNTWVDNFFNNGDNLFRPFSTDAMIPAVNVSETETSFDLELAAPGKKKEEFKIEVENGAICISSENETTNESENKNYTRKEYSYESFQRSFTLPENVDDTAIEATYDEGVLKVSIPKKEASKPETKVVEVS